MPIGPYKDFKDCVEKNKDKESPGGYCAVIEKRVTGEWPGKKKKKKESNMTIKRKIAMQVVDESLCPGGKQRSEGQGKGLGFGEGKGPIGVPKEKESAMGMADLEAKLTEIGVPLSRARSVKEAADAVQSMLAHMDGNNKAKFTPNLSEMSLREFANMFKGYGEVTV